MSKNPKILILIGKGKTTLSTFIKHLAGTDNIRVYNNFEKEDEAYVKANAEEEGICSVINLLSEKDLQGVGAGIKRRALVFKIDPLV